MPTTPVGAGNRPAREIFGPWLRELWLGPAGRFGGLTLLKNGHALSPAAEAAYALVRFTPPTATAPASRPAAAKKTRWRIRVSSLLGSLTDTENYGWAAVAVKGSSKITEYFGTGWHGRTAGVGSRTDSPRGAGQDRRVAHGELPVVVDEREVLVRAGQPFVIGRDPAVQLRIDAPLVSRRHAEVAWTGDGWVLRDLGSSNGTYLDGKPVEVVPVVGAVQVRLGDAEEGPVVRLGPAPSDAGTVKLAAGTVKTSPGAPRVARGVAAVAGRQVTAAHDATGLTRIGRNEDNDIVLRDLNVSRKHAEVREVAGGYEVADLGSANGTYLNGQRITRAALHPGDLVSIGRHQLVFEGGRLHETVDTGPVSLVADDLMVRIGDAVLLDDVSFALPSSTLLAVIGPSGCGKSTLVRAMTGLRPASQGRVRYDGRDLYADYAELRYRIGVVPQDDVLHRQLTVRRALRFSAALRFASDVPRKQRHAKVDEVLETLGLTARARQRIDTL
ncbi:MAG: FHA domain-containing protein, partial [Actinobacteria bacterium]